MTTKTKRPVTTADYQVVLDEIKDLIGMSGSSVPSTRRKRVLNADFLAELIKVRDFIDTNSLTSKTSRFATATKSITVKVRRVGSGFKTKIGSIQPIQDGFGSKLIALLVGAVFGVLSFLVARWVGMYVANTVADFVDLSTGWVATQQVLILLVSLPIGIVVFRNTLRYFEQNHQSS